MAEAIVGATENKQTLASQSADPLMEETIGWTAKDFQVYSIAILIRNTSQYEEDQSLHSFIMISKPY